MSSRAAVTAVIAAAGSGERLGAGGPKAFVSLAGRPLVEWSLAALRAAESVRSIVVACPPGMAASSADPGREALAGEDVRLLDGGATRSQSVANALALVETELVAIHDAARPLLTAELLEGIVATLEANPEAAGAIAATPVTDTVKRAAAAASTQTRAAFRRYDSRNAARVIEATEDRARLWAAQTPQVFRTEALREALDVPEQVRDAATDESTLIEAAGGLVLIHPSSPRNLKVTTPTDLRVAELLLGEGAPS